VQALRTGRVTVFFQQESEMDKGLVMRRVEIERLAVVLLGFPGHAARVMREAHEVIDLRRRTVIPQERFAALYGLGQRALIGKARNLVEGRAGRR
jgi:hypothetical protein